MPTAVIETKTIDVAYVNDPKPGKKMGNIKTKDNEYFFMFPDKLAQFRAGMRCTIDYSVDGDFKRLVALKDTIPGQTRVNGGHPTGGTRLETSNRDGERMYVCALLRAFIQAGKIEPNTSAVAEATNRIRDAWRLTFGNPQQSTDMNDEIPI